MSCDNLMERVGELGLFQIYYLFLMGLTKILCGVHVLLPVYAAYRRPYWCASWGNITTAKFACTPPNTSASENPSSAACPDNEWIFDTSVITSTIQSQYGLVCEKEMLVPLATSFFMGGFLFGGSFYGFLSDRFGRSNISSIIALKALIVSLGTAYAPTLPYYILGRFLAGVSVGGVLTVANSSCVEIFTAKWRLLGMTIASLGWIIGNFVIVLIAYLKRDHTSLQLFISISAIPGLFCYFLLPEPLRWLIVNLKIERAFKVAKRMASANKRPPLSREEFDNFVKTIQASNDTETEKERSAWEKFKSQFQFLYFKNMRRITLIMWFLFAATSFYAYSFAFSIGRFDANIYRNVLIISLISPIQYIPVYAFGYCLGRVKILIVSYGVASLLTFGLIGLYKVDGYSHYAIWVAILAKFFVLLAFLLIWLLGAELYPTQFRTSAVGSCSTLARLGALLSPQVMYLDLIWRPLPFIIYASVALLACVASIFLPETRGIPTLETADQGEEFAKRNRLWRKRWLPGELEVNEEMKNYTQL